jgi:hypothetical protein
VKPHWGRQERTLNFLVAEESSFPQDALFIRTGIAKRMVGIPATATFRRKPWRNFIGPWKAQLLRLSDGAYPLGHIRVAFTVPANNSKRADMEKLAGDHRRNLLKKMQNIDQIITQDKFPFIGLRFIPLPLLLRVITSFIIHYNAGSRCEPDGSGPR